MSEILQIYRICNKYKGVCIEIESAVQCLVSLEVTLHNSKSKHYYVTYRPNRPTTRRFTTHMDEITARQLELQKQIRQESREVRDMKANATSRSVHVTTGRGIPNAALLEHFKWEQQQRA